MADPIAPQHVHPLARAVLARFPGATVTSIRDRSLSVSVPRGEAEKKTDNRGVIGGYHQINAPIWGALAPDLVARGWSCFPQTRDSRRGPGIVDRQALKWAEYQKRLPTQEEVSWWSAFCPSHNIAGIMGSASGNVFAVDVDVNDVELSDAIQETADRILGYTPFRRVGRFPRIILLYRQAGRVEGSSDRIIPSSVTRFASKDGEDSPGAVEILGHGKPATFFGLHHGTGKYFLWVDKSPHWHGPEIAPLVSREQIDAFFDAVHELHPFSRSLASEAPSASWTFDAAAGLHRPRSLGTGDWKVEEGKVVDGRESFLFRLVSATVRANEAAARDPGVGRQQICAIVDKEFHDHAELSGDWTGTSLKRQISAKVEASCRTHIERGSFKKVRPGAALAVDGEGVVLHAPSRTDALEPVEAKELAHLGARAWRSSSQGNRKKSYSVQAGVSVIRAAERALISDEVERTKAAQAATAAIRAHQDRWIEGLYERAGVRRSRELRKDRTPLDAAPISILKGDAGVGKTSTFWRAMSRAIDTRGRLGYPVGFAMPSHANIEDSLQGAVERELAWEHTVSEAVAEGEKVGLKVVVFRGKLRTNCGFKDQIRLLQSASIQAEKLCKSRRNINEGAPGAEPEWEPVRCPMFDACEYQQTLAAVADADVVLFASAYLSVKTPKALTDALIGLVVDERPYSGLLGTNSKEPMPVSILELPRPAPRLLDEEIQPLLAQAGAKEAIESRREGYLADREAAVRIVLPLLKAGSAGKAVTALFDYRSGNVRSGLEYARSAYTVCSRGSNTAKDVAPGMSEEAAAALASTPRGEGIWEERRFWSLVIERLEAMAHDEENPDSPRQAKGTHDARLQVVYGEPGACVRMSWRAKPGFPDMPLLMLDASAAPEIVAKIWTGREVEVLPVVAPCHMRVVLVRGGSFSDYSMLPGRSRRKKGILSASKRVHENRAVVNRLAGVHGYGRLLVGGNKGPMRVLRAAWKPPVNADFCHNGAMRGLDGFKNHAAAVLFGRLELPPRAIDAFVACLTYDDENPEPPVDAAGTGQDVNGKDLKPTIGDKVIQMRDGRDLTIDDATYEGPWARLMQSQWREEEVRQFAARLRPVHRLGRPPVAYLACTAIPEGMIVDDVVDVKDLLSLGPDNADGAWDIARETDGVLDARFCPERVDLDVERKIASLRLDTPSWPEGQGTTRKRWRLPGGEWTTTSVLTGLEDPNRTLAAAIAAEQGLAVDEVLEVLEVQDLWEGTPRALSGTRAPDAIDLENTGLPEGTGRDEIRMALSDQEIAERQASVEQIRSDLSGLPIGSPEADIEAALRRRRITEIDWAKVLPYPGADRKLEAVPLAVRVLAARYGIDDAEDDEDRDD